MIFPIIVIGLYYFHNNISHNIHGVNKRYNFHDESNFYQGLIIICFSFSTHLLLAITIF